MQHTVTIHSPEQALINISEFQFGEVSAQAGTFELIQKQTDASRDDQIVFIFASEQNIGKDLHVRFNLTLQIDSHNATNIQIRICCDNQVQWRWSAPYGHLGQWTSTNDQATWQDDGHKYLIYMIHKPNSPDFWVYLGKIAINPNLPPEFFPVGSYIPRQLQFKSGQQTTTKKSNNALLVGQCVATPN